MKCAWLQFVRVPSLLLLRSFFLSFASPQPTSTLTPPSSPPPTKRSSSTTKSFELVNAFEHENEKLGCGRCSFCSCRRRLSWRKLGEGKTKQKCATPTRKTASVRVCACVLQREREREGRIY